MSDDTLHISGVAIMSLAEGPIPPCPLNVRGVNRNVHITWLLRKFPLISQIELVNKKLKSISLSCIPIFY